MVLSQKPTDKTLTQSTDQFTLLMNDHIVYKYDQVNRFSGIFHTTKEEALTFTIGGKYPDEAYHWYNRTFSEIMHLFAQNGIPKN